VPDEKVREASPVRARDDSLQVALDLHRVFLAGQTQALGESANVRIDDDPLRMSELGRDDIRGLSGDTRESEEILETARNLAVELLEQHTHRAANRFRLLPEEAGRIDASLELLLRYGEVVLRLPVLLEQRTGDAIDVRIRRLRGEHHRDEELERAPKAKRDRRICMLHCKPFDDRPDPLAPPPESTPSGLTDVATRHAAPSAGLRRAC